MASTELHLRMALSNAHNVVAAARSAAQHASDAAGRDLVRAERLREASRQMYAIASVARDAEKALADLEQEATQGS